MSASHEEDPQVLIRMLEADVCGGWEEGEELFVPAGVAGAYVAAGWAALVGRREKETTHTEPAGRPKPEPEREIHRPERPTRRRPRPRRRKEG